MFEYKDFTIERDDKYNLSLYRIESKEIHINNGKRGYQTPTGEFADKKVHKGFHSSFQGAVHQMAQLLAEDCQNIDEVVAMVKELNAFATAFTLPQISKEQEILEEGLDKE